jgi:hypothetical protein
LSRWNDACRRRVHPIVFDLMGWTAAASRAGML